MSIWLLLLLFCALLTLAYFSYRYAWWRPPVDYQWPRILMYHMISESEPGQKFKGLRVSPQAFEQQLSYLKAQGWHFVTMSELMNNQNLKEKTVAITFDDGYADNYLNALPLLQKYQAKATLYLVVDRHNRDWSIHKKAHHNSGELAKENKLSDTQVAEMLNSGIFELGAHTLTHANLVTLDSPSKANEISHSKQQLEQCFDTKVESFAYPFGIYDAESVDLVKQAGFTNAVTTIDGIDNLSTANRLELKRVKISGKDNFLAFKLRLRTGKRGWKK